MHADSKLAEQQSINFINDRALLINVSVPSHVRDKRMDNINKYI